MLTVEEWEKKEGHEKKLLYTREEWMNRSNRNNVEAPQNQRNRGSDMSRVRCFNCNAFRHYAPEYRKPRCIKEQRQEVNISQIDDDEPALLLVKLDEKASGLMLVNESKVVPSTFPCNGGKKLNPMCGVVKFGDGSKVKIEGRGSITFKYKNGDERTIHEVYYIPSLCNNILSLGQMFEEGNKIVIKGEHLWVYDTNVDLLIKVKRSSNRLYKLIIESSNSMCLMSKVEEESKLWHARLGHVNYQAMHLMSSKLMVRVDDYSLVMWVYLLNSEDEALSAFKKFRAAVENESGEKVKTLRTDRGGEFTFKEFKIYCDEAGIERHSTAPRDVSFEENTPWPWKSREEDGLNNGETFIVVDIGEDAEVTSNSPENEHMSNAEEVELDEELLYMGVEEPTSFSQAVKSRDWKQAMNGEIDSIEKNGAWKLVKPPVDHKVIGLKWIYKIKKDTEGKIVKYKERLVAKGYKQEQGTDFDEIFVPITRLEIVRLLLALAAKNNWEVHHLDVKIVF
ncbi:hypothetical protein AgCh_009237 [Apium graveolens]